MVQFLFDLLNSKYFAVAFLLWILASILWTTRLNLFLERQAKLILKPMIFRSDIDSDDLPFYPRRFMKNIAYGFRDSLKQPFTDLIMVLTGWGKKLTSLVYDRDHPFRFIGYFIFLACFVFFVLSDAIAVANTLASQGLFDGPLPSLLSWFDIAIFGGSILSLVIGIVVVFEIRSSESEFSQWSNRDNQTKSLVFGIAALITLLSVVTLTSLALFRLVELGTLESTPFLDGLLNWVLFGLVPVMTALSAAITFLEASRGFIVGLIIIFWGIIAVMWLMNYILTILGSLIPIVIDLVYRALYSIVYVLLWFLLTPIELILLPIRKTIKLRKRG